MLHQHPLPLGCKDEEEVLVIDRVRMKQGGYDRQINTYQRQVLHDQWGDHGHARAWLEEKDLQPQGLVLRTQEPDVTIKQEKP